MLVDGIYSKWSCFVQSIHNPQYPKHSNFVEAEKATIKYIEQCFGVLQAQWGVITSPCKLWDLNVISYIMYTCVIMHNMIT